MGLGGEVLQKQGVHGALEADVKLADVTLRDGDELHACEPQSLKDGRHVLLIARDAVESFGQYDVEAMLQGIPHHLQDTVPQQGIS